jgi:hypothetical protein
MKSCGDPREREISIMTLATSSSIHQAKRYSDDRQAEIRHDAERTRIGVPKASAPPDVLPEGVDDLTPASMSAAEPRLHELWLGRILSRMLPAGLVRPRIS